MNLDYYSPFLPEDMLDTGDKQSQSLRQKDTTQGNQQKDIKLITSKSWAIVNTQNSAEPTKDSSAESTAAEVDAEAVPARVGAAEVDGGAGADIPPYFRFFFLRYFFLVLFFFFFFW